MTASVIPFPRRPAEVIPLLVPSHKRRNLTMGDALEESIKSLTRSFRKAQAGDQNARVTIEVIAWHEMAPVLTRLAEKLPGERNHDDGPEVA